jgi:formylmethanofuran dehydrogenase subunit D
LVRLSLTMITGRSIRQGQMKEVGKVSPAYKDSVAIVELDPEDLKFLEVPAGTPVRVSTDFGQVIVKVALSSQAPHKGLAFIPYGPWASTVMPSSTSGTGMPPLKGLSAVIEPTPNENVLDVEALLFVNFGR